MVFVFGLKRFSIECRKTKTTVITTASQWQKLMEQEASEYSK